MAASCFHSDLGTDGLSGLMDALFMSREAGRTCCLEDWSLRDEPGWLSFVVDFNKRV